VTSNRVRQLVDRGFLPVVQHQGRWYLRRHQVEVIANARESRRVRGPVVMTRRRLQVPNPHDRDGEGEAGEDQPDDSLRCHFSTVTERRMRTPSRVDAPTIAGAGRKDPACRSRRALLRRC
jgi:hypothetical protein